MTPPVHTRMLLCLLLLLTAVAACRPEAPAPPPSAYAGEEGRAIKALSPEEVERYLNGEGMGLAKAAELNHYPGPRHALELADRLDLAPAQREQAQRIFDEMHAAAVRLGAQVVAGEQRLDSLFAAARLDDAGLQAALRDLAVLQGELRYVHLHAHLQMKALLTPDQVRRYDHLRGYGDGAAAPAHAHQHAM